MQASPYRKYEMVTVQLRFPVDRRCESFPETMPQRVSSYRPHPMNERVLLAALMSRGYCDNDSVHMSANCMSCS